MTSIVIKEGRLDDAMALLVEIPEFENLPSKADVLARISSSTHLILTAHGGDRLLGFKIGYEREGRFYSWLGAVSPTYRGQGVATHLADYQEKWAKEKGYDAVWLKTRNCFPGMIMMAVNRGFQVIGFSPVGDRGQHRIVFEKSL